MPEVDEHYQELLGEIYSWFLGGFEKNIASAREFFEQHSITPRASAQALDLGCGPGFHSIALAEREYSVTAIDFSEKLLAELRQHATGLDIKDINDDLLNFAQHCPQALDLVLCMTDTIVHLPSQDRVVKLLQDVYSALEENGQFILSFRDLTHELELFNWSI